MKAMRLIARNAVWTSRSVAVCVLITTGTVCPSVVLLKDGRDTDTAPAQLPCDLRQDAGAVQHHKAEVIERADFFHRPHPKRTTLVLLERGGRHSPDRSFQQITRDGDEIADHRTAGRHGPRAPAIEHHVAHGIATS